LVSLKDVRMSIRKGKAYPRFCDAGTEVELARARECFERNQGRNLTEFNEDELRHCFSDAKLAEAGISTLGRFYSFRSRTLNDLLGEQEAQRLAQAGIDGPMELRLRFFEFLSGRHSGFMSSESREWVLREFAEQFELGPDKLEEALWLDEDDHRVLTRVVGAPPENLGQVLNVEILSAILCSSYTMRLGPVAEGSSLKFVFRNLRFYGLLYRIVRTEDGLIFEVDGPLNIFGRPQRLGYRMMILVFRLRQLWLKREFDCGLSIEFRKGKKRAALELKVSELPDLAWPNVGELKLNLFDSKVEAKIYSTFKAIDLGGWRIEREPTPFVAGSFVFIPDFSVTREGNQVFIEVVGFWTPEYKKRKKAKFQEIAKAGLGNLIILVDEKAEGDFNAMTDFPIFTYTRAGSSYRIPYSAILDHLEAKFPRRESEKPRQETPGRPTYVKHGEGKYKVFW